MVKRVAVIGAGISGLVSIKCCLDEGLSPVCFEQGDEIGGIWAYHDEPCETNGAAIYESLVTNTCSEMTCFSDFPFPEETPVYLRHHLMKEYYNQYAEKFALYQFINFNTKVLKVTPTSNFCRTGQWVLNLQTGEQSNRSEVFDAVMCCTGLESSKNMPKYKGSETFEGLIMHSNCFKRGCDFREKTVIVVGDGNSAGDVASEVSRYAKQVYISMRDGTFVILRMGREAIPIDKMANKRILDCLPNSAKYYIAEKKILSQVDHDKLGLKSSKRLYKHRTMLTDDIANRIFCGAVKCRPVIKQLKKRSVEFVDGTIVDDVDAIICATGYNVTFPYIDIVADGFDNLELYLHVFPPHLKKHTLAFIGFVGGPASAGPGFELQARWSTRVFKGLCNLPDEESMMKEIKIRKDEFYERFGKHGVVVNLVQYQDRLADLIGAKPNFWKLLLTDPKLAYAIMFGPCYPATYRLTGPGVWNKARETIMNTHENHSTKTTLQTEQQGMQFVMLVMVIVSLLLLPFLNIG